MISRFATVYAGHVDLPDRGQDATPANERRMRAVGTHSGSPSTTSSLKATRLSPT
jgi:hypothetical protein